MLCAGCQRLERKVNVYVLPVHTPSLPLMGGELLAHMVNPC